MRKMKKKMHKKIYLETTEQAKDPKDIESINSL